MANYQDGSRIRSSIQQYAVGVLLLACLSTALVCALPLYRELRVSDEQKLAAVARARASHAALFGRYLENLSGMLASRTGLRSRLAEYGKGLVDRADTVEKVRMSLVDVMAHAEKVVAVACFDAKGEPLVHLGAELPAATAKELMTPPFDQEVPPIPFSLGGIPYLAGRIPIFDAEHHLLGAQTYAVELGDLHQTIMEGMDLGPQDLTLLVAKVGEEVLPIYGDREALYLLRERPTLRERMLLAAEGGSGVDTMIHPDGADLLFAYAPVGQMGWGVAVFEETANLHRRLHGLVEKLLLLWVAVLAIGVLGLQRLLAPMAGRLLMRTKDLERELSARTEDLREEKGQLVRLTEQLRLANEQLDSFTRTAAHDLRTPLVGIKGYADLLADAPLPPERASLVKGILNGVIRANRMVTALLEFARAGRMAPRLEELDLTALAEEAVVAARGEYGGEVRVTPGLRAWGDPELIRNVLQNLIENALKYAQRSPEPQVEVGSREDGAFYVRDNGIGFDMLFATKIFDPFTRLHLAAEYSGTGIGLSTVKRIIEGHGGEVWAESEGATGATFYFTLPEGSIPT